MFYFNFTFSDFRLDVHRRPPVRRITLFAPIRSYRPALCFPIRCDAVKVRELAASLVETWKVVRKNAFRAKEPGSFMLMTGTYSALQKENLLRRYDYLLFVSYTRFTMLASNNVA